jgi:putative flippase GtrA
MAVEQLTGGAARDEAGRIARFVAVGGTGFLVDAAVLAVTTELLSVGALPGRAVSFSIAVVST